MSECSYCNEPLNEDEIKYFNIAVLSNGDIIEVTASAGVGEASSAVEMPLCSQCILEIT